MFVRFNTLPDTRVLFDQTAIIEMLIQLNEGYPDLFSALPDAWAAGGRFSAFVTRGDPEPDCIYCLKLKR